MDEITVNPILFIVGFFVASKQAELIFSWIFKFYFVSLFKIYCFYIDFPKVLYICCLWGKKTLYKFQILKYTFLMYIGAKW